MITKPRKKISKRSLVRRNPDDVYNIDIYSIDKKKLGRTKSKIDSLLHQMYEVEIIYNLIKSYENGKWITFYTKSPLTGNQTHAYEKIIRGLIELEGIENTGRM